ncbi:MAG: NAD-dependent epimerase/dehydratase family protein [Acidimicrobiales bacterium]|nr:NAD-dependent epimerase/dehydratase family protein [Acidimicrobiales bacterium]
MATGSGRGGRGPGSGGSVVVVTGAAGPLGRRVCELAAADPAVARVVALDRRPLSTMAVGIDRHQVELALADLKPLCEGADVVVHLAQADGPHPGAGGLTGSGIGDGELAHRVLDVASSVGASHVVLLSSATSYGAWANNPVPLTEDAPLRPNPGVAIASEKAELERAAADWREDHPGTTVTVLRPCITVAAEGNGWLARALSRASTVPVTEDEPPAQFLDVADLASAVDVARRMRLDGPRNVAPDGWISGETARQLAGGGPRVRLPERVAVRLAGWRWRWGMASTPPELLPYTVHPWVVANDRLRADGWEPTATNEEAYVASHQAGPWATMSPRRRQELALGATGVVLVGAVVGVVALVRRCVAS